MGLICSLRHMGEENSIAQAARRHLVHCYPVSTRELSDPAKLGLSEFFVFSSSGLCVFYTFTFWYEPVYRS